MADLIVVAVVLAIIAAAVAYIVKEKKKGVRCIGCPAAGTCGSHNHGSASGHSCGGNCGCHTDTK
ncbi:MAG: FeoB-associated Cys-rich membrane protein [Ruminococcus sp.]|nr:FeoB-associated Cys-rich membrane protein [Ruminococcus sp.]